MRFSCQNVVYCLIGSFADETVAYHKLQTIKLYWKYCAHRMYGQHVDRVGVRIHVREIMQKKVQSYPRSQLWTLLSHTI